MKTSEQFFFFYTDTPNYRCTQCKNTNKIHLIVFLSTNILGYTRARCGFFLCFLNFFRFMVRQRFVIQGTHIEFDVFQWTVKDLVQSLTVDSSTVSKQMSRTSVRHDVILAHDTPRIVAEDDRRPATAAADRGEKTRRQPGSPGNPNTLSNRTIAEFFKIIFLFPIKNQFFLLRFRTENLTGRQAGVRSTALIIRYD